MSITPTLGSVGVAGKVVEREKLPSPDYFSEWTEIILDDPEELG